jgi:hypothetical protein
VTPLIDSCSLWDLDQLARTSVAAHECAAPRLQRTAAAANTPRLALWQTNNN